jgi:mannitol 2-dehydrogenase
MADVMRAQDALYTLVEKPPSGDHRASVIGSLTGYLLAPPDPEAVIEALAAPSTRIASLTITEGGYEPGGPAFGLLVEALRRRRDRGTGPLTVMSCDNVPGNGEVARRAITASARGSDAGLADWIEGAVRFPSSMVDRITPQTTDADREMVSERFGVEDAWPVVCEPYVQWVLEDDFAAGRPPYEDAGVQLVGDVEPYELMKLRLLNASHQALCYLGYLSGYRYAHEVCQDPLFVDFLLSYMDREATPTLHDVPGVDLTAYKHQLIERFANPKVRDTLARLCAESSDRIPKWLVPVIRTNLEKGGEIERSALVVASWARYAEGVDEQGDAIQVVDQLKDRVMAAAARQQDEPLAFIEDEQLFGDLAANERFAESYTRWLASLHDVGARLTLERLAGRADSVHD